MHFQFLIEDFSGRVLVEELMKKVQVEHPEVTCDYKSFHGIGGFTKKNTVKDTKDGKLLNDLATYLAGFNKSLVGIDAAIFVVLDNDDRNPELFRVELETVAVSKGITIDHVFCIAVEEMEAWLLGDEAALRRAYPDAKIAILHSYKQDSICGTWEVLADAIYKGGSTKIKKAAPSYPGIGKFKSEWAMKIGEHMDIHKNQSPSFNYFIGEVEKRILATA